MSTAENSPKLYLKQALALAETRLGLCAPNPSVGCVIVKDNKVIGEGCHLACGEAHAEVAALEQAGANAKGAVAYVTLEPCAHVGRTPPCTDALIKAQVSRVVYGFADPNPQATGGAGCLREEGIECQHIHLPDIAVFYAAYVNWVKTKTARLTAKIAISQDGKYASIKGPTAQITGGKLGEFTAKQRLAHDAILTSIKTVLADDPQMNVRLADTTIAKPVIILDSQAALPLTAKLFDTAQSLTIIHAETAEPLRLQALEKAGVTCVAVASDAANQLEAAGIAAVLGKLGYHRVWIETGGLWLDSLLAAELVSKLYIYSGVKTLGETNTKAFQASGAWLERATSMQETPFGNESCVAISFS